MVHLNRSAPTVLLADADVFIDYRDSDIEAPEVKTDMADLRAEVGADVADLSTEVKTDIADLRADVESLQTDLHAIETRLVASRPSWRSTRRRRPRNRRFPCQIWHCMVVA